MFITCGALFGLCMNTKFEVHAGFPHFHIHLGIFLLNSDFLYLFYSSIRNPLCLKLARPCNLDLWLNFSQILIIWFSNICMGDDFSLFVHNKRYIQTK